MREQGYVGFNSDVLKKYLTNLDNFHFEQHGYDEESLKNSHRTVEMQRRELHDQSKPGQIWFSPQVGQPFLFWNDKNELDISGILNYNPKFQTGTFRHNTISGELCVDNVHSYFVMFNMQISCNSYKYMPFFSMYLPDYEEARDMYVPMIIQDGKDSFALYLLKWTQKTNNCTIILDTIRRYLLCPQNNVMTKSSKELLSLFTTMVKLNLH